MSQNIGCRITSWTTIALSALLLTACARVPRYDGTRSPDPSKAIIIGSITEGFITEPNGLVVEIEKNSEPSAIVVLETMGKELDLRTSHRLGNLFMYEVPAGEYKVTSWNYVYYSGSGITLPTPTVFKVKAGEVAYIGDFYAHAATVCLYNVNHESVTLEGLKHKYPMLKDRKIINLTAQSGFGPWPSSDSQDNGKGLCKF
ncbi:hypothetical protein NUH87_01485 [Pseudomonas batumici]|uniref:hypothetical protein n=1 Tax=Pseudomonas batumici TaxID=226910 RepID=UPI0030D39772